MARDPLTYDDLLRIVELVKSSEQFSEFRLKIGDIEVELRRGVVAAPQKPLAPILPPMRGESESSTVPPEPVARSAQTWPDDSIVVRSPMVGTFYRAPQPGAPPFVEVGRSVNPETIVCIIEVMKLLNSIPAGAHGTVTHVLIDDAAAVEAGQPLIVVAPAE